MEITCLRVEICWNGLGISWCQDTLSPRQHLLAPAAPHKVPVSWLHNVAPKTIPQLQLQVFHKTSAEVLPPTRLFVLHGFIPSLNINNNVCTTTLSILSLRIPWRSLCHFLWRSNVQFFLPWFHAWNMRAMDETGETGNPLRCNEGLGHHQIAASKFWFDHVIRNHEWSAQEETKQLYAIINHKHSSIAHLNQNEDMTSNRMESSRGTSYATALIDRSWKSLGFPNYSHFIHFQLYSWILSIPTSETSNMTKSYTWRISWVSFRFLHRYIWIFQHHPWHFVHPQQHVTPVPTVPLLPFWEGREDGRKLHRWQISGMTWSCGHPKCSRIGSPMMDLFEPTCSVLPNDTNAVDMIGHIYRITPLLMASQTHLTFPNESLKGLSFQREFVRLHWCFILMQVGQWILITSVASVGRGFSPQSWNRNHPMS